MTNYTSADFKRDFPDDDACLEYLKSLRWPNGITCKKCERVTKHHRVSKRLCYACDFCGTHVYPQAGTILQDSRTPLTYWFRVIFLMAATRMGIAAKHIERELGVTYKTAWRMCRMVRRMMNGNDSIQQLLGEIEIDESYFGGSESSRHLNKRSTHKRMSKQPALGMVERKGRVVASTIPLPWKGFILPGSQEKVMPKSLILTDEVPVYDSLRGMGYRHKRVNHSQKVYVAGVAHTNLAECFWSITKNGIRGSNRYVGPRYLDDYVNAYAFRWNRRRGAASMFRAIASRLAASKPTPTIEPLREELPRNPIS